MGQCLVSKNIKATKRTDFRTVFKILLFYLNFKLLNPYSSVSYCNWIKAVHCTKWKTRTVGGTFSRSIIEVLKKIQTQPNHINMDNTTNLIDLGKALKKLWYFLNLN